MKHISTLIRFQLYLVIGFCFIAAASRPLIAQPRNVIFFIGDGMGFEHVKAARCYHGESFFFESLPCLADCSTHNVTGGVTDSAASATAIATGYKVQNGVISLAIPGDGSELLTILEMAKSEGKSTGLTLQRYQGPLVRFSRDLIEISYRC